MLITTRYPCPAYKNPSDYYLDLVTLDDLSPEAMLESSQRVEQLSSIYQVFKNIFPTPVTTDLIIIIIINTRP